MKQPVWASFFHKQSTDENPQRNLCPTGDNTWCKYNKSINNSSQYKHKNSLPEPVMLAIKSIYRDLSDENLLKRCLHGKTQNPNESLNHCIWKRLPKTEFTGLTTLQLSLIHIFLVLSETLHQMMRVLAT